MKKLKLLFLMLVMVMCLAISGCGGGFFAEEVIEIASIDSRVEADGTTILTITYVDDIRDPDVFKLPKGAAGNGIKSITSTKNIAGDTTTVTITYTDDTQLPTTFDIKDGVSVKGVEPRTNEETGEISLVVVLSDGTESEPFPLPKGEKGEDGEDGEDGNGLIGYKIEDLEDGGVKFIFHFSKFEDVEITIPAPKQGEKGNGIDSIMGTPDYIEGMYYLEIIYTDVDENGENLRDNLSFAIPKETNGWLTMSSKPDDLLDGKDGDYCFDTYHKIIYVKENGKWNEVISFNENLSAYFVKFFLNDANGPLASMPSGSYTSYIVAANTYFTDNGYPSIPEPTRPGYEFVGWFRGADESPTNGMFTNLTPILSNLDLYARWEILEYTISYKLNGGQMSSDSVIKYNVNTETFNLPTPEKAGHKFMGWYTSSEFEGDAVIQIIKGMALDLELYAKWEEVSE